MLNNALKELQEQMEWHEKLATSDYHKDDIRLSDSHALMEWHEKMGTSDWHKHNPARQNGHLIAAMSYNRATQIIRKHADKA
jgi:hypothetical protein